MKRRINCTTLQFFSSNDDPTNYEEVVKIYVWRKDMDLEIESIETNDTWNLTALPKGSKTIGVKGIYKTKYNEKGEVYKHKSILVANEYSERHVVHFNEVFAPVARWDTIRTILIVATIRNGVHFS